MSRYPDRIRRAAPTMAMILATGGFAHGPSPLTAGATQYQRAGGIAFASDWRTATGNTMNAVQDGGKWIASNIATPVPDRITVVPAAGLGFPREMTNVLAIRYEEHTSRWSGISRARGWALPNIGGVLARRMYFRMNIEGTNSATHHPVQSAQQAGPCAYAAEWVMNKGPTFQFRVANLQDGRGSNPQNTHAWETTLTRNQTYRVEELYRRTGPTTWKLQLRIYDQNDVLIRQNADFRDSWHNGVTLAHQPDIVTPDPTCMQQMMIVNQGVGGSGRGSDNPAANRIYYGGFAVSLTDWVGPYRAGEAP